MLEQIRALRKQAMISRDKVARYAYEAVVTECDNAIGRSTKSTLKDKKVIDILKTEIAKYNEIGRDKDTNGKLVPLKHGEVRVKQVEYDLLMALVPEVLPQLADFTVRKILDKYDGVMKPNLAMAWLDDEGYADRYNKGIVAKIVLGR